MPSGSGHDSWPWAKQPEPGGLRQVRGNCALKYKHGAAVPPRPGSRWLFRVQSERLAGAIITEPPRRVLLGTAIAVVILVIALTGKPGIIVPFLLFGFGIVTSVWRQFNTEFGTVVAEAPDGLRLRSGLIQTAAGDHPSREGAGRAPRGRAAVLARVRLVQAQAADVSPSAPAPGEPLRVGQRPACAHPGRVTRRRGPDARRAADRSAAATNALRQPARGVKTLLSYHFLAWASDDRFVVASRGRVCRQTTWVPLEKVQSIPVGSGPLAASAPARHDPARRCRAAGNRLASRTARLSRPTNSSASCPTWPGVPPRSRGLVS